MAKSISPLIVIAICLMICVRTDAASYHCDDRATWKISMHNDEDLSERLITTTIDKKRYEPSQMCRWEIQIVDLIQPRYLVLQPMTKLMNLEVVEDEDLKPDLSSCNFTLNVVLTGSDFQAIWTNSLDMPGNPLIVPVYNSSQKLVTSFATGDSESSADCPRVELNIMLVKKGFCGRNMLLHRSHCHLISDREIGMADLRETGLRLTPFSSMDDVRHLIKDNDLRKQQYPYNQPLDLSSPVRVGVFRCPGSSQGFYWNSSNGSCVAQPFSSTAVSAVCNFATDLQCAVIFASVAGEFQMKFADCAIPMKSLLSFLEVPPADSSLDKFDYAKCQLKPHDMVHVIVLSIIAAIVSVGFVLLAYKNRKQIRNMFWRSTNFARRQDNAASGRQAGDQMEMTLARPTYGAIMRPVRVCGQ